MVHTGLFKSHGFMELFTGGVGQGHAAVNRPDILTFQNFNQRRIQGSSDSPACTGPADINGKLSVPLVSGTLLLPVGIGVAHDYSAAFINQIGVKGGDASYPFAEFLIRGQLVFKGYGCVNIFLIDLKKCRGVLRLGFPYHIHPPFCL